MSSFKPGFGSDNHSGVHPAVFQAMSEVNVSHASSYGSDEITAQAEKIFRSHFGEMTKTFFVFNGTAANVLGLQTLVKPYQAILCSDVAHLNLDECGAPEKHLGCKLIPVPTTDAKLTPELLEVLLIRRGDQHAAQIKAISITQPTELGTVYSVNEIKALSEFAKKQGLFLHMDGSRLVNAAASLGVGLDEITVKAGVDVVSFGGTKNGLLFGEAVLFFNGKHCEDFKYIRKQGLNLPSKTRFLAAQFLAFLGSGLWRENATHALKMAQLLEQEIKELVHITQKVQSNAVFALIPKEIVSRLREKYFFYIWDEHRFEARLMMSFDTQREDVLDFARELKLLLKDVAVEKN